MPHRHEDWLAQARRDLKVARDNLADQNYEWCSFQCHQSAEKALKALRVNPANIVERLSQAA
jgi:HEPN domain-containing protein